MTSPSASQRKRNFVRAKNIPDDLAQSRADYLQMLKALRDAVANGDAIALQQAAHNLKGSSSYLGAQAVLRLSADLEQLGRRGLVNNDVKTLLAQLEGEFQRIHAALTQILNA